MLCIFFHFTKTLVLLRKVGLDEVQKVPSNLNYSSVLFVSSEDEERVSTELLLHPQKMFYTCKKRGI